MSTYELGRQRLIDRVKVMTRQRSPTAQNKECLSIASRLTDVADDVDDQVIAMAGPWSPTALRKECLSIARRLTDLADDLDGASSAWSEIEDEHDKQPPPLVGRDGYPIPQSYASCSYQATVLDMRALAESAKRAAENLPNSRERFALPFAAMGLIHLKVWHGQDVLPIDVLKPIVEELQEICEAACIKSNRGESLSGEALRNELRKQWGKFDRCYFPPGIWEVVSGG